MAAMTKKTANILLIADEVKPAFYQYWRQDTFQGIDLIISCGDLPARYLEFIATMFSGDVLYVAGNHDTEYQINPPLGCFCIDDHIYCWKGLRFLGLGGSMRYKEGPYQYTEHEMKKRVHRLWLKLFKSKGFDILVSHAPAYGHFDAKDPCHTGFEVFNQLIHDYKPKYFFHGHIHLSYGDYPRVYKIENTTVINGYESYLVTIELPEGSEFENDRMF